MVLRELLQMLVEFALVDCRHEHPLRWGQAMHDRRRVACERGCGGQPALDCLTRLVQCWVEGDRPGYTVSGLGCCHEGRNLRHCLGPRRNQRRICTLAEPIGT